MSQADRLKYYFKQFPPNTLITHDEIADLLWRKDPEGGPLNLRNSINQRICKLNQKLQGYKIKADCRGRNTGYRMVEHG